MWQKELIEDFYLVIGRSDGSEILSHVVDDREKAETKEAIESGKERIVYATMFPRKSWQA